MRSIDFGSLSRSSIGFDRLFQMLDVTARSSDGDAGYPPYNIEKIGEEGSRLEVALGGFSPDEQSITVGRDALIVAGRKSAEPTESSCIKATPFTMADLIEVKGAKFTDGIIDRLCAPAAGGKVLVSGCYCRRSKTSRDREGGSPTTGSNCGLSLFCKC